MTFDEGRTTELELEGGSAVAQRATDKQSLREELERIERENGGHLTPGIVVQAAKPKASPLHNQFEWDNRKAGEKYRLWQARKLIKIIPIRRDDTDEPQVLVPAFMHIAGETGPKYMSSVRVVQDDDLYARALRELCDKVISAARSVEQIIALRGLTDHTKRVLSDLGRIRKVIDDMQDVGE